MEIRVERDDQALAKKVASIRKAKAISAVLLIFLVIPALVILLVKSFEVEIQPEDARSKSSSVAVEGIALYLFDQWLFVGSRVKIGFSSPGFSPASLLVETPLKEGVYLVELDPLDGLVTIDVDAPQPWTLSIDSIEETYTESPIEVSLPPGRSEVSLNGQWFKPLLQSISIHGRGEKQRLKLAAEAVVAKVYYSIMPNDSLVLLDGTSVDADRKYIEVPFGDHEIEFNRFGYAPKVIDLEVDQTQDYDLGQIDLKAYPVEVAIKSSPSKASVFIDEKYVGVTPLSTEVEIGDRYIVKVRKRGFDDKFVSISPQPGKNVQQFFDLSGQRLEGNFTSNVEAIISVNGVFSGSTPLKVTVGLGDTISATTDGYVEMINTVPPWAESAYEFHFDLISEDDYPYISSPEIVRLDSGLELKKFPGGQVSRLLFGPLDHSRQPDSDVVAPPFYLSTTEVTVRQYNEIMGLKLPPEDVSDTPITGISWNEAALFANAVSKANGLAPFYIFGTDRGTKSITLDTASKGFRLPTETEWLYVAKQSGSASSDVENLVYWGERIEIPRGQGNFAGREAQDNPGWKLLPHHVDNHVQAAPVKSYRANSAGIHDLDGNVAEWIHNYVEKQEDGRQFSIYGPEIGLRRIVKGGSFRTSSREDLEIRKVRTVLGTGKDIGFRLAKSL